MTSKSQKNNSLNHEHSFTEIVKILRLICSLFVIWRHAGWRISPLTELQFVISEISL